MFAQACEGQLSNFSPLVFSDKMVKKSFLWQIISGLQIISIVV